MPDTRWLLAELKGRFAVVSNDAEHTPEQLSRLLQGLALEVAPEQIVLAGTTAIDVAATEYPGAKVLLLGSTPLRTYARRRGLVLDESRADIVLVARDRYFTYRKLALAADAVSRGAQLLVAAPDRSHPGPHGQPIPETGALAAAILAVTGPMPHRIIGKPEPALFTMGCTRLGLDPLDVTMIGDNPETDGLGARRLGMRFIRVHEGRIGKQAPELLLATG